MFSNALTELVDGALRSYSVVFAVGVLCLLIEWVMPPSRRTSMTWRAIGVDLALIGLNAIIVIGFFMVARLDIMLAAARDSWRLLADTETLWIQVSSAFFLSELLGYWRHRLMHSAFLWPVHAIHHSSKVVTWLSSRRLHPLNVWINRVSEFALLYTLGFGIQAMLVSALLREVYTIFIHSQLEVRFGLLRYLLVSPLHHRLHHSSHPDEAGTNFAFCFSFLDLAFGTYREPRIGIVTGCPDVPLTDGLLRQLAYPLVAALPKRQGRSDVIRTI